MEQKKDLSAIYEKISKSPKYKSLVSKRARFSILLSGIVLATYYAFMLVVAFSPATLGQTINEGGAVSVGWPIGAVMVIGYWILTGVYVYRANGEFETMSHELIKEMGR